MEATKQKGSEVKDYGRLVPLPEAAERLGVSVCHLRDLCLRGEMASVKIGTRPGKRGGRRLIPESELSAWVARNLRAE